MSQSTPATLPGKTVGSSATVLATLAEPADANPVGNVHGGHIMKLVDQTAAAAAIRHAGRLCVTASIDRLDFLHPVRIGDLIELKSTVNFTHRTSMEVGVHIETENLASGKRNHVASAYLIFVALDEQCRPVPVPPVIPETAAEKLRFQQAELRYRQRKELVQKERALDDASHDR